MSSSTVWRTPKPYVVIVALGIIGYWWLSTQGSFLPLRNGRYACTAVYVNESGKYERLTRDGGAMSGEAVIREGKLVEISGDHALDQSALAAVVVRPKGTSHFVASGDHTVKMYYGLACDHVSSN